MCHNWGTNNIWKNRTGYGGHLQFRYIHLIYVCCGAVRIFLQVWENKADQSSEQMSFSHGGRCVNKVRWAELEV